MAVPTGHFPGSDPAVITEEEALALQEANLQIFPPNNGCDGGGRGHQTVARPHDLVGKEYGNDCNGAFCFASYTQYSNPNLYGLIWISTTLVFVIASLCNCATYLMGEKTISWSLDLSYFLALVMGTYGILIIFALGYDLLHRIRLLVFWDMCRYSLFIAIPSSLMTVIPVSKKGDSWIYDLRCFQALHMAMAGYVLVPLGFYLLLKNFGSKLLLVIPVGILRWTVTLISGIASAAFVGLNLKCRVLAVVLVAVCVFQFALAMFIKSWYFRSVGKIVFLD
ncbi:hypothetical protein L1987_78837 [Smallanthus sonchifolius]|uniref:Uncharacterized protein n=1 Tax=Smallanthus sonchifolius TaxID=185202 RepID=A0ACB8ZEV7_9ASTR|nr:hypothetical protein L1987_78837 [Smallanthus sonchifolius]